MVPDTSNYYRKYWIGLCETYQLKISKHDIYNTHFFRNDTKKNDTDRFKMFQKCFVLHVPGHLKFTTIFDLANVPDKDTCPLLDKWKMHPPNIELQNQV